MALGCLIKPMLTTKPRYTPKIKSPHQLQSIRIQRKLLYKAYGLAVSTQLARVKGVASASLQQGAGAVYIARSFDYDCVDDKSHNVTKRIETPTFTKHNAKIKGNELMHILQNYDAATYSEKETFSDVVNYMVVACGFTQTAALVGEKKPSVHKTIVDVFPVKQLGKEYTKKIMFSAGKYWEQGVKFGNSQKAYTLLYAQDAENEHMFLIRLTPDEKENISMVVDAAKPDGERLVIKDKVFESLVIMNKFRKMEISLPPMPNYNKAVNTESIKAVASASVTQEINVNAYLKSRVELMKHLSSLSQEDMLLKLDPLRLELAKQTTTPKDTFHPTYAFLRTRFPMLRYLPAASSPETQTQESIPYISQVLTDFATLHWIYAGLRAVAATMIVERDGRASEKAYKANGEIVDQLLFSILFGKTDKFKPIEQQTPQEMLLTTALAADLVSALYVVLKARDNQDQEVYERQLINLYQPDGLTSPLTAPSAYHYGHRIAVRLLLTTAVRTQVGDKDQTETKPVILSIKSTTPWSTVTDSSETWNATVRFSLYRRQMLNLAAWMGKSSENPAWAQTYRTSSIFAWWDPVKASYAKHPQKASGENRTEKLPGSANKEAVISVDLNLQRQLQVRVHTYLKRISGTTVSK